MVNVNIAEVQNKVEKGRCGMTAFEKIKEEIIHTFTWTNEKSDLHYDMQKVLQIIDKYAERQKCDTCYHNKTEFSVCQYCTDGDKYEEVDEWQNGYDMAWEEAEVFYEKEEPTSPCDLCRRYDHIDGYCGDCPAMPKGGAE